MPVRKPPVDLHESRAGVVGPGDRSEVPAQRAGERRVHPPGERVECRTRGSCLLLDLVVHLLIVGDEEERLVAFQGAAEREAELVLAEVGRERLRTVRQIGREPVVLTEVMNRALDLVRARLGDHVHEARARSAELGRRSARRDDDLLNGVQVEGEGRPLPTALLAEERVVEVRSIDRDVVVDSTLSRHVGREEREIEEIAPVVR